MPKMKSHSACKKRFKKLAGGKIKRSKAYKRHHAWAKNRKQINHLGETAYFNATDTKRLKILLPY